MKKIFLFLCLVVVAGSLWAQGGYDVKTLTTQIVGKLTPALSLTAEQANSTTEAVTDFLSQKAEILPLQSSDPAGYASKFNILNGNLVNKLKAYMQAKQLTTFWSMKPRNNDPANALSQLFY